MILKYTIAWLVMPFIGIMNGIIREYGYAPLMAEVTAHQVSTVTGIILFGLFTWGLGLVWKLHTAREAILIGLLWLLLTIAFEFLFGHYVMQLSWSRLVHDYNLLEGRVWSLLLIWITIAPYVIYKIRP
ncbi:MAG TPA: hypothetical protein DCO77_11970 [Nitrospiraceae bacterium]|nr:hypothetical protein [Nitrospiraceae bacterium]